MTTPNAFGENPAVKSRDDVPARDSSPSSKELKDLAVQIAAMRTELLEIKRFIEKSTRATNGGFLDSRNAAVYCGISRGTFDKYRYTTQVKLKGYRLDGKVLYKREDLDAFVQLYEIKSAGVR